MMSKAWDELYSLNKIVDSSWKDFVKQREGCIDCYKPFVKFHSDLMQMHRRANSFDDDDLWAIYMKQRDGCKECSSLHKIHKDAQLAVSEFMEGMDDD